MYTFFMIQMTLFLEHPLYTTESKLMLSTQTDFNWLMALRGAVLSYINDKAEESAEKVREGT